MKYRPIFDVRPLFSPLTRPYSEPVTRKGSMEELLAVERRRILKQVFRELERISPTDLQKFACQIRKS